MNTKTFWAVLAGIFTAGISVFLLIGVSHILFPIEFPEDINSFEEYEEFVLNLHPIHDVLLVLANGLGLVIGMYVARLIDRKNATVMLVVAGIMILMSLIESISTPHPAWFPFINIAFSLIIALAYIFTRKKS